MTSADTEVAPLKANPNAVTVVAVLFFLSGFSALVYQVAWMRQLSLFFGSDVYSAAITLAVFFGGLSLGSLFGGRIADRLALPLVLYGALEIGIGAYALFFTSLLDVFQPLFQAVYREHFDSAPMLYHGFRTVVAAGALLAPTAFMGATLPLILRGFVRRVDELGARTGAFYGINTFGALAGTLTVGFVLLPTLGMYRTVWLAAAINLLIGAVAIVVGLRLVQASAPAVRRSQGHTQATMASSGARPIGRAALITIALSGAAALALEVVWTRILVQSFSGTVFSFAIMLASFLAGIFYGSVRVARTVDRHPAPALLLARLELWLGASVAALAVASYVAPHVFATLLWSITALTEGNFAVASVITKMGVSVALISIPTMLLGATFPVAVKLNTPDVTETGRDTGEVYAANTAGGIAGALLGGFVLVPTLGARNSLLVIALTFLAAAAVMLLATRRRGIPIGGAKTIAAPLFVVVVCAIGAALLPPQVIANYGLQQSTRPEIIFHAEGVAHTLTMVRNAAGDTIMLINGNVEADTTLVQRRHFVLKGHLPLLLHPNPRSVAVVGLGLGITLAAIEHHPNVERIQVIELSPEMVEAQQYLRPINGGVLEDPKVSVRIDDGRNFMTMSADRFDMVTADPIHPRITGTGFLYTREYYQAIKRRLLPGGIVLQWMPMYQVSPRSFNVAFRTFAKAFPNALFVYVRGHGLFVAANGDLSIDLAEIGRRLADPQVTADLTGIGIDGADELLAHVLMGPRQIADYLRAAGDATLNTDDNAYLEYHTPFEFLGRTEEIVRGLLPFAGLDADMFRNAAAAQLRTLAAARQDRIARILPELSEEIR